MNIPLQTEIKAKRAAWWAEHFKPGMTREDAFRLNEELLGLFPATLEEREQKGRDWEAMGEFVL
jgi:hypothetical protein